MKRQILLKNVSNRNIYRKIEFDLSQEFKNGHIKINEQTNMLTVNFNNEDTIESDLQLITDVINKNDEDIEIIIRNRQESFRRVFILENLDCANCAAKIERIAKRRFDHEFLVVDIVTLRFIIETTDEQLLATLEEDIQEIAQTVDNNIIVRSKVRQAIQEEEPSLKKRYIIFFTGIAIALIGLVVFYWYGGSLLADPSQFADRKHVHYIVGSIFFVSYLFLGGDVLYGAIKNIKAGRLFDEKFLMGLATLTALAINNYVEAVSVMLFYKIGELLQDNAVNHSRRSIKSLIGTQSEYANVEIKDEIVKVDPLEVFVGDILIVRNGERIPLDGEIISGATSLDMSALTGESLLREVEPGDQVLSGSINKGDLIKIKTTKLYEDSTMSKIVSLVEDASSLKSKSENFISKFARYYTPTVVIMALIMIFVLPFATGIAFRDSIYKAMIFLVISCPCALVISIPLGFFGGIGGASRHGILVKGSNYLEALNSVHTVVFDKTGTLTKGNFKVTEIHAMNGYTESDVLEYAAYAETVSTHPIARSIINEYGQENIDMSQLEMTEQTSNFGVQAKRNGKMLAAGNKAFISDFDIEPIDVEEVGVVVHVVYDNIYMGYILITDEIKEEAAKAINDLKAQGVKRIVMLTGDNDEVGREVANRLGIDEYKANLLPADKVAELQRLKRGLSPNEKTVFAGDGVNDAPALSSADIGIAMGALGSDAAIEVADVVLMSDEISKLPTLINIARKTRVVVMQNIILTLAVKLIVLVSASLLLDNVKIWEALFADVGVSLIAVLNATRVIRHKPKQELETKPT